MSSNHIDFSKIDFTNLDFRTIQFDVADLALKIKGFVHQGSQRYTISIDDIQIHKGAGVQTPDLITLDWLFSQGNPFFDSIFYIGLEDAKKPEIIELPSSYTVVPLNPIILAQALFYQYFMILTRGSISDEDSLTVGSAIPNFLKSVMGYDKSPKHYANLLSTFQLRKIDPAWAKFIPLKELGRECVNRLGLGVAGYRLLNPFKLLPKPDKLTKEQEIYYGVAISFISQPASWDIHSATRDPNVLSLYGPLNANLGNLALEIFKKEDLERLVSRKSLFKLPIFDESATNYKSWNTLWVTSGTSQIF